MRLKHLVRPNAASLSRYLAPFTMLIVLSFISTAFAVDRTNGVGALDGHHSAVTVTALAPEVDIATVNSGRTVERDLCLTVSLGFDAASECGDLRIVHPLPGVTTLGRTRFPTLLYNSQHAHPQPIVAANVRLPGDTVGLKRVTAVLRVDGTPRASSSWRSDKWPSNRTARIALTFDAIGDATGVHPYVLEVVVNYGVSADTTRVKGDLVIVNRKSSEFGSGWWLSGLDRLIIDSQGNPTVWIGGDGSVRRYTRAGTDKWSAPSVDRPDSIFRDGTGFQRILSGGVKVRFDAQGRHIATRSRLGHETTFSYDGSGRLATITPPFAPAPFVFVYDASGKIERIESPYLSGAARTTRIYSQSSRIDSIMDPDSSRVRFRYAGPTTGRIVSRTDRRGVSTKYRYDGAWRVAASQLELSSIDSIVTRLRAAEVVGFRMSDTASAVDTALAYTRIDGPRTDAGDTTLVWVNRFGSPKRIRDAMGGETVVARGDPNFPALVTEVTDAAGMVSRAWYSVRGNPDSTIAINPYGNGINAVTRFTWDPVWDAVTRITLPEGETTTFAYDPQNGNRLWQQRGSDPARRATFSYANSTNQLSSVQTPLVSGRDSVEYDARGNVSALQSPKGYRTLIYSDELGRDTLTRSPVDTLGQSFVYSRRIYDVLDREILNVETSNTPAYTGSVPDTLRVVTHYDAEGNADSVSTVSAPDRAFIGLTRHAFVFDGAGRKTQDILVGDPAQQISDRIHTLVYDAAGNLLNGGIKGGSGVANSYDAANRITQRIIAQVGGGGSGPDTSTFTYDVAGRIMAARNRGARVERSYFPGGALRSDTLRVATLDYSAFSHVYGLAYTYDLDGRRRTVLHPSQLLSQVGGVRSDSMSYDAETGDLSSITDIAGKNYRYQYDLAGRSTSLTRLFGDASQVVETFGYDDDSNISAHQLVAGGTSLRSEQLSHDARGKVVGSYDAVLAGVETVTYSPLGPVTESWLGVGGGNHEVFTLDALGNIRTRQSVDGEGSQNNETQKYLPARGQLSQVVNNRGTARDTTFYNFNSAGSMLTRRDKRMLSGETFIDPAVFEITMLSHMYDGEQRPIRSYITYDTVPHSQIFQSYAEEEKYRYDALGRRVWKRMVYGTNCTNKHRTSGCHSAVTRTVWDGAQILYEVRSPGDTASPYMESDSYVAPHYGVVSYTHGSGIDKPLAIHKNGELVLPQENWRGSTDFGTCPVIKCNESEIQFAGSSEYAYGSFSSGPNGPPSWYGSLIESQTDGSGLQYKRNRYYDPKAGKFTQEDPIGLAGGMNLYGFAGGDPVNFSDPFGLCPPDDKDESNCGSVFYARRIASSQGNRVVNEIAGAINSCHESTVCGLGMWGLIGGGLAKLGTWAGLSTINVGTGDGVLSGAERAMEKQLASAGRKSLEKTIAKINDLIVKHEGKIADAIAQGRKTSSMEREIRAFKETVAAARKILERNP